MNKKKGFVSKLIICVLTAVTVLTSSITSTDIQAGTPKAIKVQSFKRTGTKTAILKFKKPARAIKYMIRYSFYQDFNKSAHKGYIETSKVMALGKKGKSKKYTTASKKYTTITTPKSGSTISVKIEDPRLSKITYNYRKAMGCALIVDGTCIEDNEVSKDDVVYFANGYQYTSFYCAVQIRYYNKGWSKWSKAVRLNDSGYQKSMTTKELSRTEYYVCGDGHPAGSIASNGTLYNGCGFNVSREIVESNPDVLYNHIDNCPYNQYGNFRNADLVKYAVTYTWK